MKQPLTAMMAATGLDAATIEGASTTHLLTCIADNLEKQNESYLVFKQPKRTRTHPNEPFYRKLQKRRDW